MGENGCVAFWELNWGLAHFFGGSTLLWEMLNFGHVSIHLSGEKVLNSSEWETQNLFEKLSNCLEMCRGNWKTSGREKSQFWLVKNSENNKMRKDERKKKIEIDRHGAMNDTRFKLSAWQCGWEDVNKWGKREKERKALRRSHHDIFGSRLASEKMKNCFSLRSRVLFWFFLMV